MTYLKWVNKKSVLYALAWGLIPLAYLSWCFSTIAYKNSIFMLASGIVGILAAMLYCILERYILDHKRYKDEILVLNICIFIVGSAWGVVVFKTYDVNGRIWTLLALLFWLISAVYGLKKYNLIRSVRYLSVKEWLKKHIGLIILVVIVIILAVDPCIYQFKWDGLLYYNAVSDARLDSISSVALYGHIAMSSGAIYGLFAALCGDYGYGMIIANIVVLIIGICSFYGTVKIIAPDKKDLTYILATASFAFSPFILGMSGYYSTDWFCVCLITPLVYFVIKKKWILVVTAATVFCCTKEPALIAYMGLCIGLLIDDMIDAGGISKGIAASLRKTQYYFMLIPYILWFATYKILGQWSAGDGAFDFNLSYILSKLAVFCVLNFNWIIFVILVLGFVFVVIKGRFKDTQSWFIPPAMSNVCLLIFNVVFKTSNHARYIDSFISVSLILSAGLLLTVVSKERFIQCIFVLLAVISLISCFATIDPVSLLVFDKSNTGYAKLLSTGNIKYGDPAVYNRQMLWMEKPINEAISDCIDENSVVVLLMEQGSVYSIDGMSEKITVSEKIDKDTQFWDRERRCRIPYSFPKNDMTETFDVFHVESNIIIDDIDCEKGAISVIYIRDNGDYRMSDRYEYIDTKSYSYRGWIITRDIYRCQG